MIRYHYLCSSDKYRSILIYEKTGPKDLFLGKKVYYKPAFDIIETYVQADGKPLACRKSSMQKGVFLWMTPQEKRMANISGCAIRRNIPLMAAPRRLKLKF